MKTFSRCSNEYISEVLCSLIVFHSVNYGENNTFVQKFFGVQKLCFWAQAELAHSKLQPANENLSVI